MAPFLRSVSKRFGGSTPPLVFLVVTVALALWLGYQALDAASSHREVAEGGLTRYSGVAATQMATVVRSNLDFILEREIFDDLDRRRRGRFSSARAVAREMRDVADDERCECPLFRDPLAVLRIDPVTMAMDVAPDTLSLDVRAMLSSLILSRAPERGRTSEGLITLPAGGLLDDEPAAVGYMVTVDRDGVPEIAYGFLVTAGALGELVEEWWEEHPLLEEFADEEPNDSLFYVAVTDPSGAAFFTSSDADLETMSWTASESLSEGSQFGDLAVRVAVRPDRAGQLIPGGLPQSRLPLLAVLLVLTLGMGAAAAVQLRREQTFQRLRDDFVSGVSHELRTPLAQIRMFAELQESGKLRTEDDRRRATFVISREAKRLSHLVENILQFSRLRRTPEQGMPRERLDLADALADGVDAATPLLDDRGMKLELEALSGLDVVASRDALTRIVVNLLDNAAKYGPAGQTVRVGLERLDGSVLLSVSDEGPGVPEADRDRVWKAYRRLERDVKAQLPGTGIGLSVVSELAALHEGRAWVEDAAGGGARFVVELPLAATEPAVNGSGARDGLRRVAL